MRARDFGVLFNHVDRYVTECLCNCFKFDC